MIARHRFLVALLASLTGHLGILSGLHWPPQETEDVAAPAALEARLVEVRPAQAQPGSRPARPAAPKAASANHHGRLDFLRKAEQPSPSANLLNGKVSDGDTPSAEMPVAPALPPDPPAATEDLAVEDSTATARPAPAAAMDIPLPRRVRIHYEVTMGDAGFVIGRAEQELRHDGVGYALRSTARTIGLAGFFRPAVVINVSEGDVVASGLRPRQFRVERGNGRNEAATFDWETGRVTLSGGRVFPLEPGAQDMLSMFCQLSLLAIDGPVVSLSVATGKKIERHDFEVLGEERIMTPRGERATVHLRHGRPEGRESTEIWLGLDDARLPVKIRHIDRRGDMFEQIADRIEFDNDMEGWR